MSRQYTGWLGWSNTRGGIDFYHSAEDGRHNHDPQYQGHGHLLAFDITTDDGLYPLEGHKVVVIVGNDRAEEPEGTWFTKDSLAAALVEVEESKLDPRCIADQCDHGDDDPRCMDTSLGCGDAAAIIQAAKEAERE